MLRNNLQCKTSEVEYFQNSPRFIAQGAAQNLSEDTASCVADQLHERGMSKEEIEDRGLEV